MEINEKYKKNVMKNMKKKKKYRCELVGGHRYPLRNSSLIARRQTFTGKILNPVSQSELFQNIEEEKGNIKKSFTQLSHQILAEEHLKDQKQADQ